LGIQITITIIKTLKTSFRLYGLTYTLLERNEYVALFGISGTYADEILHYEVDVINIRKDRYGEMESIAGVEENLEVILEYSLVWLMYPCNRKWTYIQYDGIGRVICRALPSKSPGKCPAFSVVRSCCIYGHNGDFSGSGLL